jgi:hypothetical protein
MLRDYVDTHWRHLQSRYARQLPPEGAKGLLTDIVVRYCLHRHHRSFVPRQLPPKGAKRLLIGM